MKKLIFTFLFLFLVLIVKAQVDCPQGYEERSVRCSGKIVTKCVPVNYTCNNCWMIQWQNCDGNWNHAGGAMSYSSYKRCLEVAEQTKSGTTYHPCPESMNKYVYRIFLDDVKFCSTTPNSNATIIGDIRNKLKSFLQRYREEISSFKKYYSGESYRPGAVFKEYESTINQAELNANTAETISNNISDNNLAEAEMTLSDMQVEENNFLQKEANIKNQLNIVKQEGFNNKNGEQKRSNDSNKIEEKKIEFKQPIVNKKLDISQTNLDKGKENDLLADNGEKEEDIETAKNQFHELELKAKLCYLRSDSLRTLFFGYRKEIHTVNSSTSMGTVKDIDKNFNEHAKKEEALASIYYKIAIPLCRSQIKQGIPVSIEYLNTVVSDWELATSSYEWDVTDIENFLPTNNISKAVDATLNYIDKHPKRQDFDPMSGGDNGTFWLGPSVMQSINGYLNLNGPGIAIQLPLIGWGNHFQLLFEGMYVYYLNSNPRTAEIKLGFAPNSVKSFKRESEISVNLGWGPYLIKRKTHYLVFQPTVGLMDNPNYKVILKSNMDNMGNSLRTTYDFELKKNLNTTQTTWFYFRYGAFLRFYANNFMFSLGYMAHAPFVMSFSDSRYQVANIKFDLSQASFGVNYRL
jgi:hypothetical protein